MSDTPSTDSAHAALANVLRGNAVFASVGSTIGWDEQTQLPDAATGLRADQSSLIAEISHERRTDPKLGDLIAAAEEAAKDLPDESDAATTARDARRDYDRATKLPADLVAEMARAEVEGHHAWVAARKANDYASFEPHLATTIRLKRREAECVGYKADLYDALLDDYEPGETTAGVRRVFDGFKGDLIQLVGAIADSGKRPTNVLRGDFPVAAQHALSRQVAAAIGFDFDAGRLDVAVHPFCTGLGPGDTRMTTRFDDDGIGNSFFSTLHETGHALYEQGLPKAQYFGSGCAQSISLGIHESQSRMWENLVGRSRAFWQHFWPTTQKTFKSALWDVSLDEFLFAVNDVRPSFIRTESDEATYNLHVLLRFELEQALLGGDLATRDLPDAWDERMRSYLGVVPPEPSQGCLQDVHWSAGLMGYFPTYTLGNLYAAQFFEAARWELGDLDAMFARGEFAPLLGWLREKIHRVGRRKTARQLVKDVTGQDLNPAPLLSHLKRKAGEFYGV